MPPPSNISRVAPGMAFAFLYALLTGAFLSAVPCHMRTSPEGIWAKSTSHPHTNKKVRLAPTGKKITFTYVGIYRIVNGKIVERETVYDLMDFYRQPGVIEYKELPEDVFVTNIKCQRRVG